MVALIHASFSLRNQDLLLLWKTSLVFASLMRSASFSLPIASLADALEESDTKFRFFLANHLAQEDGIRIPFCTGTNGFIYKPTTR
jgi:hypothetical protein